MISPPPQQLVADFVRQQLTARTGWDAPHEFTSVVWDGSSLSRASIAVITPDVHPRDYPQVMSDLGFRAVKAWNPERPLVAFMLIYEAHGVVPPVTPTRAEAARFARDRKERRFHERPDAFELAQALCAGLDGRLWSAVKRRPEPDHIDQIFHPDANATDPVLRGNFVSAIATVAQAAAEILAKAGAR